MPRRPWRNFDLLLLLATLLLIAFGIALIYSASRATTPPDARLLSTPVGYQLIYAAFGLGLMFLAASIDYRLWGSLSPFLYGFSLFLLALVLFRGESTFGARRWLEVTVLSLQPSELAKLALILILAKYLADHREHMKELRVLAVALFLGLVPALLVYLEPNLGTVIVMGAIWLALLVMAGVRPLHLGALVGVGAVAMPFAYFRFLHEYMRQRLAIFLDPGGDPLGAGYNVLQSEISVGSGGLWGKGFLQGTQSQLHFLRIQQTDFVFSVLGEELGFVGAMALFALFILLLLRGVRAASLAPDTFGRLAATGVVAMLLVQVFIHIGVNTRLLPPTGLPLPLISYGGSSLVTVLLGMGLLQSIAMRRRRLET